MLKETQKSCSLPAVEPSSLGIIAALGDEQADGVWSNLSVVRVYPDVPSLIFSVLNGDHN